MISAKDKMGLLPFTRGTAFCLVYSALMLLGLNGNKAEARPLHQYPRHWRAIPPTPVDVPLPPLRPAISHFLPALAKVPLPPRRPPELAPAITAREGLVSKLAPTPADNDALRQNLLASGQVVGESLAPITGTGECGVAAPLRLEAVVMPDGKNVVLSPPAVMRASLAAALANWLREDLGPGIAAKGDRLAKLVGMGGYQCRSRDGIATAKLSEHAIGNAFDMQAFVMASGKIYAIADSPGVKAVGLQSFLTLAKATACRRFMTVLGPGADGFHTRHLHIDLEARRHGTHLCEWTLPPLSAKLDAPTRP